MSFRRATRAPKKDGCFIGGWGTDGAEDIEEIAGWARNLSLRGA
jgi:hypothetical protein